MNDPKRIAVVSIPFILLILCILGIKGHTESNGYKTQVLYTTAIQLTDKRHFNYAVDTQQGNLLVSGMFKTEDKNLVKFPEMTKGFTYVKREKEHYTMHTREVCTSSGKNTTCHTEIYYSWDTVDIQSALSPQISIFDRSFNTSIFNLNNFIDRQSCEGITPANTNHGFFSSPNGCENGEYYLDSDNRYVYSTVPQSFNASFLASSMGGGLSGVNEPTISLENKTIDKILKDVGSYKITTFWVSAITIIILTAIAICVSLSWVMADGEWSLKE